MLASLIGMATVSPAVLARKPEIRVEYANFKGLTVYLDDVPVITGSSFQYYEKNWVRGIYSSSWKPVEVMKLGDGRIQARFTDIDGTVAGTHTYTPTENGVDAALDFRWRGEKAVMLEVSFGRLWAPLVAEGRLEMDGNDVGVLNRPVKATADFDGRQFGRPALKLDFDAPLGSIQFQSKTPVYCMDARNYSVEWAKGQELFWLGATNEEIKPQETLSYQYSLKIDPKVIREVAPPALETQVEELDVAVGPDLKPLPLVPKPKSQKVSGGYISLGNEFEFVGDEKLKPFGKTFFEDTLWTRWDKGTHKGGKEATRVNLRIGNLGLEDEGYRLEVNRNEISIIGEDEAGVQHGLRTLTFLGRPRNGTLTFDQQTIVDWPSVTWRGVHMFVGPTAMEFQGRLLDRVLGPVKYNKVVLQAERTNWEAIKGTETSITMDKKDLIALAGHYKRKNLEVIPLIQSLGHAGWIFANGKNLDIAVNPDVPFTMDPRKAKTREVLTELWTEVHEALEPETVHFGMDEIDMRGMPDDPSLSTRFWNRHMPFLMDLSKKLGVKPMMWGDIMLHTSEAPDAAHAKTKEDAKARRSVVDKGTYIADWHYKDDPNPATFKTLKLWQEWGMKPIGSNWFRLGNIRGQTLAAAEVGAGMLQTTWAGYESSEANMVRAFDQFSAYIVAADYAWSGRKEMPDKLGYDPDGLLQRLYFGVNAKVSAVEGQGLLPEGVGGNSELAVGSYRFTRFAKPLGLRGVTSGEAMRLPDTLSMRVNRSGSGFAFAIDALARIADNEPVAVIRLVHRDGSMTEREIVYGRDVRSVTDDRPTMVSPSNDGISAITIPTSRKAVTEIQIERKSLGAGLRLHGITVY